MTLVRGSPPFQITPNVNSSWCEMDMKETRFSYVWTIKKFSRLPQANGQFLQSSLFSASESDTVKWILLLYPRGNLKENEDYVSLFLQYEPLSQEINAEFEISVLKESPTSKREKVQRMKNIGRKFLKFKRLGLHRYIKRDYLMTEANRLLKNDELTIQCEIVIFANPKATNVRYISAFVEDTTESKRLSDDLERLLNSKNYCDVVLVAEDKEIQAHKALIGARSPVFNAIFQRDMQENRQNRVIISDIGFNVLEELVKFIYTGELPDVDDQMLMQLFSAADKYALEGLMVLCDKALSVKLTAENVIQFMPLASLQNTNHLKASLIQFMKSMHSTNDALSELWKLLISQHPQVVELLINAKRREK